MPRRPRIRFSGMTVHVIQRGNNHTPCFFSEGDYRIYLHWLRELSIKTDCTVHAYCLMGNHVHLLLTSGEPDSVSQLMKTLGQRYVQYINRTYERTGTLWEGRFRSSVVQDENYVLACYRYIDSNPVRAGMVQHPSDYRWSSFRVNAGLEPSAWLVPHPALTVLGEDAEARHIAYRKLCDDDLEANMVQHISACTNGGFALGDEPFIGNLASTLNLDVARGKTGRPKKHG